MVKTELRSLLSGGRELSVTFPEDNSPEYLLVRVPSGAILDLSYGNQFEIVATSGVVGKAIIRGTSGDARLLLKQRGLISNAVTPFSPINHNVPLEALIGSGPMAAASRRILSKAQCMPGGDLSGGSNALEIDKIHPLGGLTKRPNHLEVDPIILIAHTISYLQDTITYSLTHPNFQRELEQELISPGRASFSDIYSALQRAFPEAMCVKKIQDTLRAKLPFSELSRIDVSARSKLVERVLNDLGLMVYFNSSSEGSPKDILLGGVAKCTGFSKAYVELTNRLGLDSETRFGLINSNGEWEPHMWAVTDVSPYGVMEVDPTNAFMGKQKEEQGVKLFYNLAFIYGPEGLVPTVEAVKTPTLDRAKKTLFASHDPTSFNGLAHCNGLERQVATYR